MGESKPRKDIPYSSRVFPPGIPHLSSFVFFQLLLLSVRSEYIILFSFLYLLNKHPPPFTSLNITSSLNHLHYHPTRQKLQILRFDYNFYYPKSRSSRFWGLYSHSNHTPSSVSSSFKPITLASSLYASILYCKQNNPLCCFHGLSPLLSTNTSDPLQQHATL